MSLHEGSENARGEKGRTQDDAAVPVYPLAGEQQAHDIVAASTPKGSRACVRDCPQPRVGIHSALIESGGVCVRRQLLQRAHVVVPNCLTVEGFPVFGASAAQTHEAAAPAATGYN